jgi:DNA-binding GntR family transcriptional regulator
MITESLLADILQGKLAAGQHLVIAELAGRYLVSPTPIREALVALEGIGIVDFFPNRGAVVRRLTRVDAEEICQVRQALECEAVRLACGRIDAAQLAQLAQSCRGIQATTRATSRLIDRSRTVDNQLHDLIRTSSGNRLLIRELQRLMLLFRGLRDAAWRRYAATADHARLITEAAEHLTIIERLQSGRPRQACCAMSQHIRGGLVHWIEAMPELAQ